MDIKSEIKSYLSKANWTLKELNDEINKRNNTNYTYQNLVNKLTKETIRYKEVKEIADITGYEIKWINKNEQIDDFNKWNYEDYFSSNVDEIFLHGIKRLSAQTNTPLHELYIKAMNYLTQEYLLKDNVNKNTPEK